MQSERASELVELKQDQAGGLLGKKTHNLGRFAQSSGSSGTY